MIWLLILCGYYVTTQETVYYRFESCSMSSSTDSKSFIIVFIKINSLRMIAEPDIIGEMTMGTWTLKSTIGNMKKNLPLSNTLDCFVLVFTWCFRNFYNFIDTKWLCLITNAIMRCSFINPFLMVHYTSLNLTN